MDSDIEEHRKSFIRRFLSIFSNNAPYSTPIQIMSLAYRGNILNYDTLKNPEKENRNIEGLETKIRDICS